MTPITKNGRLTSSASRQQGKTPIAKNVRVVDDAGNPLQSTYPKRALGLVKSGRARFIDEHTIELTRPPAPQGKETIMQTQSQDHNATATVPFGGRSEPPGPQVPPSRDLAANDILKRIDLIISETAYLRESLDALQKIESGGPGDAHSPGDIGSQAKAMAIAQVIEQREQTNREMIALLKRMYDDISPAIISKERSRSAEELKLLERLIEEASEMSEDTLRVFLETLA